MKSLLRKLIPAIGIPLLLLTAASLTIPGLPAKKLVKFNCQSIDVKATDYPHADVQPAADWKPVKEQGLTAMLPPSLSAKKEESDISLFSDPEQHISVIFEGMYDFGEFDLSKVYPQNGLFKLGAKESSVNKFLRQMNHSSLQDYCDLYDLILHMDLEDCNIHSLSKSAAFMNFAYIKELVIMPAKDIWKVETETGTGYLRFEHSPEDDSGDNAADAIPHYTYILQLFDKKNRNTAYDLYVSAPDAETCLAIVNSVEIEP